MKYKVGDRVRIKSLDWYNKNKGNADKTNSVWCEDSRAWFFLHMSLHCGKIMTIENVWANSYTLEGSDSRWTDDMIEGLVEEETKPLTYEETVEIIEAMQGISDSWECPQGYQFVDENGNVINATKIVLEKKKKEYPKTFMKCCEVLSLGEDSRLYTKGYKASLIQNFQKLLICRDAYWKIAGEEMGLGKPWEPSKDKMVYSIYRHSNEIETDIFSGESVTFEFPTAEMRDAFRENFDKDLETCKKLL